MSSPPSVPNSYWGSETFRKDSVGWSSSLKAPDRPRYEAPEEFDVRQPIRPIKVLDVEAGEDDVARELGHLRAGGGRRDQEESAHLGHKIAKMARRLIVPRARARRYNFAVLTMPLNTHYRRVLVSVEWTQRPCQAK